MIHEKCFSKKYSNILCKLYLLYKVFHQWPSLFYVEAQMEQKNSFTQKDDFTGKNCETKIGGGALTLCLPCVRYCARYSGLFQGQGEDIYGTASVLSRWLDVNKSRCSTQVYEVIIPPSCQPAVKRIYLSSYILPTSCQNTTV